MRSWEFFIFATVFVIAGTLIGGGTANLQTEPKVASAYSRGYAAAVDSVRAVPPSMMPPLLNGYRYVVVPPDSAYPKMIIQRVK